MPTAVQPIRNLACSVFILITEVLQGGQSVWFLLGKSSSGKKLYVFDSYTKFFFGEFHDLRTVLSPVLCFNWKGDPQETTELAHVAFDGRQGTGWGMNSWHIQPCHNNFVSEIKYFEILHTSSMVHGIALRFITCSICPPLQRTTSRRRVDMFLKTFRHKPSLISLHNWTMQACISIRFCGLNRYSFSFKFPHKKFTWV